MRLKLLGGLTLEPSDFTRPKPLLLLAYLSLEGARSRRDVAELFWQGSKDPMQSLRMVLSQLRDVPEAIGSDEKKVWTALPSDFAEFKQHLSQDNLKEALALYKGPFVEGFDMSDAGAELEEWLFQTRESLAGQVRDVMVELAEQEARAGQFKAAASRAEEAYLLRFAPEPESDLLSRMYTLLRSNENPQAESVSKEARAYDLELNLSPEAARKKFAEPAPRTLQQSDLAAKALPALRPGAVSLNPSNTPGRTRFSPFIRAIALVGLLLLTGLLLAFFALQNRPSTLKAGLEIDDADVALNKGDNYFCIQHSQLFLSSTYEGQSTALRFRDIGLSKPVSGKRISIKSALIIFTVSEHNPDVAEGSGFIVRGLFDSSPWLENTICEQKHPPAGDNYVSRVRTVSSVVYTPNDWAITEKHTVDVTAIVQEIVNSPDWTGDGVAFAIDKLITSTANLKAYSNEGGILLRDLSRQPQFVVTFSSQ